jgi:isoleucyl-tRNA synthetase
VLWQALQDLVIAASPALVFTADEVWQHHPALIAAGPSVHLAQWPQRPAGDVTEWERLVRVRDAVNAAIEPLRAAKSMASPAEADVTMAARPALLEALAPFRDELAGFLLVARIAVRAAGAGELDDEQEMAVQVSRTEWPKCERCWTHREDVAASGSNAGLCGKCAEAMAAQRIAMPEASGGAV